MSGLPFHELRALAALELELDLLIAEKVASARRSGLSWDAIAEASGVSRPSAWRRWHTVVDDPHPTRAARRDVHRLRLAGEPTQAVHRLAGELARRTIDRQDSHPWSNAVRDALQQLSLKYEVVQRGARETEYRIPGKRLQITCVEPGTTGAGGLAGVALPDPELSLDGTGQPRATQLTTDNLFPVGGDALTDAAKSFIREMLDPPGGKS